MSDQGNWYGAFKAAQKENESLRAQVAELTQELGEWNFVQEELRAQLAASQAYAQQLREAMTAWAATINYQYTGSKEAMTHLQVCDNMGQIALNLPSDDTALKQWGAKLLREAANELESNIASVSEFPPMISPSLAINFLRRKALTIVAAGLDPADEVMKGRT